MKRFDAISVLTVLTLICTGSAFAGSQSYQDDVTLFKGTFEGEMYTQNLPQSYQQYDSQWFDQGEVWQDKDWQFEQYDLSYRRPRRPQYRNRKRAFIRKFRATDDAWHSYEDRLKSAIRSRRRTSRHERDQMRVILADGRRVHRYMHEAEPGGSRPYDPRLVKMQVEWLRRYGGIQDSWYDLDDGGFCDNQQNDWYEPDPEYPNADWRRDDFYGQPEPGFFDFMNGGNDYATPNYNDGWQFPQYDNGGFCSTPQVNDWLYRQQFPQRPVYREQPQVIYEERVYREPVYRQPRYNAPVMMGGGETFQHTMNIGDGIYHIMSGAQENDDRELFGGILSTAGNVLILGDILN